MDKPTEGTLAVPEQHRAVGAPRMGFFDPKNLAEAMQLAKELAKSDIVPTSFRSKPENILIAFGMGMEVGISPFQALQSIYVVNGRPSLWGDAVLGIVQQAKTRNGENLLEYFEEKYDKASQTATCIVKRRGDSVEVSRSFSMDDARKAGLAGKDTWKNYPTRMLQMRARSWALRDKFADLLKGLRVREEEEDYATTAVEVNVDELPTRRSEIGGGTATATPAAAPGTELITEAERRELHDLSIDKGVTPEQMKKVLREKFGVETSKDLPRAKLSALINLLVNGEEPPEA